MHLNTLKGYLGRSLELLSTVNIHPNEVIDYIIKHHVYSIIKSDNSNIKSDNSIFNSDNSNINHDNSILNSDDIFINSPLEMADSPLEKLLVNHLYINILLLIIIIVIFYKILNRYILKNNNFIFKFIDKYIPNKYKESLNIF